MYRSRQSGHNAGHCLDREIPSVTSMNAEASSSQSVLYTQSLHTLERFGAFASSGICGFVRPSPPLEELRVNPDDAAVDVGAAYWLYLDAVGTGFFLFGLRGISAMRKSEFRSSARMKNPRLCNRTGLRHAFTKTIIRVMNQSTRPRMRRMWKLQNLRSHGFSSTRMALFPQMTLYVALSHSDCG